MYENDEHFARNEIDQFTFFGTNTSDGRMTCEEKRKITKKKNKIMH